MIGKANRRIAVNIPNEEECLKSHDPNEITKKAIEDAEKEKGLKKSPSVEDLFKKLKQ